MSARFSNSSMAEEHGRSDAGRSQMLLIAELVGPMEDREYLLTDIFGRGRRFFGLVMQVFQQDHELVTPQTGYRVAFPDASVKALGDLHQHGVADIVAMDVVQQFEIVEIDEQQSTFTSASRAGGKSPLQTVVQ